MAVMLPNFNEEFHGPAREFLPHYLRMETDPVSETFRSLDFYRIPDDGKCPKSQLSQIYLSKIATE
jgi:hypothetical protein